MLDYTVASYKHLVATDDDGLRFVNIFNWEWEIDGLWLRKGYGPDSLTPLSSDKKDRGQMLKDLVARVIETDSNP